MLWFPIAVVSSLPHPPVRCLSTEPATGLSARDGRTIKLVGHLKIYFALLILNTVTPPAYFRQSPITDASYINDVTAFQRVADLMTEESTIIDIWCNILSTYYFPFPEYIIKPEARLGGSGHRADLLVTRSCDSKVVMIIEGKKAGGAQATWDKAVKQSSRYFDSVKKLGLGATRVFGMAVVGRKVTFVAPNDDGAESVLWGIKVQRGKTMAFRGFKALDVVQDSGEIHALLTHISECAKDV
ncbi:hypothetical protein M407DRAFT_24175 [Tulasnella calospora MUT 4182]|uniref:Fungal-type protein kinase domain-containing protein n=1 Tax=Tulasnella calospora MUT 4182 TaxID=1051891 RepID=A0A0C3LYT9_9AGAM|nr:hypothetical protein M407DRAFT_24175 [Tulasnella calospora MUT 4182]